MSFKGLADRSGTDHKTSLGMTILTIVAGYIGSVGDRRDPYTKHPSE